MRFLGQWSLKMVWNARKRNTLPIEQAWITHTLLENSACINISWLLGQGLAFESSNIKLPSDNPFRCPEPWAWQKNSSSLSEIVVKGYHPSHLFFRVRYKWRCHERLVCLVMFGHGQWLLCHVSQDCHRHHHWHPHPHRDHHYNTMTPSPIWSG